MANEICSTCYKQRRNSNTSEQGDIYVSCFYGDKNNCPNNRCLTSHRKETKKQFLKERMENK